MSTEGTYRKVDFVSFQRRLSERRLVEEWTELAVTGPMRFWYTLASMNPFMAPFLPPRNDVHEVIPMQEFRRADNRRNS